jgi:foldase protein PrsA
MSKRFLLSIILVLIIINIATLLFWNKNDDVTIDNKGGKKILTNEPVATVGNEEISYHTWQGSLQADHGEVQLKKLIDRSVVKQLAEQENIKIDEKIIDHGVALLTTMQGVMTEDEVVEAEKKWREDILHRHQLEALLAEDIRISEEEVQSFYTAYHKQYEFTASLQFSHIIVDDFDTAEKIIEELEEGASFAMLAKEYSIDEETRSVGGYLGYFTSTSQFLPTGYYDKGANMEEHSYSEPFNADGGVAIIYLHRYLPDITFTYDEIKDQIRNELALQEAEQVLSADPLWGKLDVEWIYE